MKIRKKQKHRCSFPLKRQRQEAKAIRFSVYAFAAVTLTLMFMLLFHIAYKGVCGLNSYGLFDLKYNRENLSMLPALINTVTVTILTLALTVPAGVLGAVYLTEYATKGSIIVKVIRLAEETLAATPSVIYGIFGYGVFVISLGWGYTMLSGVITLSIMVLPVVMRTAEESLLAVPQIYREAGLGLGADKLRIVFSLVIPSAIPGIISGISLAVGRIVGESAALIFTAGTYPALPDGLFSSTRTLAVHIYALMNEGMYESQAYAAALILIILIFLINAAACLIMEKFLKINFK